MGIYVYKVTGKKKVLKDGTKANIAVFAYKPVSAWSDEDRKFNTKMFYDSGCYNSERYVGLNPNYTGKVVLGKEGEIAIECNSGTFEDTWFDYQISKQRKLTKELV